MNVSTNRPPVLVLVPISMLCTLVAVVFGRLAYGLVLPVMRETLELSYSQAANLGTLTALGYLVLLLYAGVFAGRHGGKKSILLGLSLGAIGYTGLSLFSAYPLLMLCMTLMGFGTAFTFTPLVSLLGAWYPERRGMVIGFAGSGVGIGILLAGALIPVITQTGDEASWRMIWASFAGIAVFAIVLVMIFLRDPPLHEEPVSMRQGLTIAYQNPHVMRMALIYGVVGLTYIVQVLFMYSFALDAGVDPQIAGRLVAVMGFVSIFSGPGWGWLADLVGHGRALIFCMTVAIVATLLPVIWPETWAFTVHFVLVGLSVTGLFTSVLAAATSTVKPQHAAMAVSFVTVFFALGQLIGPALAGLLIDWQQDFRLTFALSAVLMFVGALVSYSSLSVAKA
ncbi:MFS transporter [Pseudohongiella sp.]|uniref:Major facilitator superfamily (MFS) profile domain-containing protein n=1 Tax=marine sediment metagenome TaxID=412755 RepID=A0A0F9YVX7_9ZZZZ|nr:MFS transporter [Pseudohongiella sp.]HDZ07976.1 MFS transporter [Pseudohongiella sp.]HEA64417.1 MFS transporter [Pseudohongiella sp.]